MDPQRFFEQIPPITKWLVTTSFVLTLAGNFGIVNPSYLALVFSLTFKHFELWRLVTTFLFGGQLGFPFLVNMVFLYKHSRQLEEGLYKDRPADYLFFICFSAFVLLIVGFSLNFYFLALGLMMAVIYHWSRANETAVVTFWFGISFPGSYLPWALCIFTVLTGGVPIIQLFGILAAHIFHFLTITYPSTARGAAPLISTPWFFHRLFPAAGHAAPVAHNAPPPTYPWGEGRALGGAAR